MTRSAAPEKTFLGKKIAAIAIMVLLLAALCVPAIAVLFAPIHSPDPAWCVVTSLDRLPLDGKPKLFPVMYSPRDAWEKLPPQTIGFVYLRRLPESNHVVALSSSSPWLGCGVSYDDKRDCFRCACHHHEDYDLDGRRIGSNPAPRDLDSLNVRIHENKVAVKWQQFQVGTAAKTPTK